MWLQYNTSKPLFQAFSEILSRLCHNFYAPSKFSPQPLVSHPNFQGVLIPRTLFPLVFSVSRRRFSQKCPPHAHFPHPPTGFPQAPLRPLPPSVEEAPQKSAPSQFQQPKDGGNLVSTHAALSPELGSRLKARSGCKSGTTAPGVQGAGRGPLATSLVTFLPVQESDPPVGAGPDNPSGGMPGNPRGGNPLKTTGGETPPKPPEGAGKQIARAPSGPCGATSPSGRPFAAWASGIGRGLGGLSLVKAPKPPNTPEG